MQISHIIRLLCTMVVLYLTANSGLAQVIEIKGFLYDSLSGLPIESAHIFIDNSAVGSVSSKSGEFALKVPLENKDDSLIVSCIGYKKKELGIHEMMSVQNIILMAPAITILSEVTVTATLDSGHFILDKAIEEIENNYPKRRHLIEGFYRELSVRDTSYTRLIEACILVDEVGYSRKNFDKENLNINKSRVQIKELRKSDDNRTYDKMGALYNFVFGEKNDLYEILEDNYIRFLGKKSPHFLSTTFMEDYDIRLAATTETLGKSVYVVTLEQSEPAFFTRKVKFYINKEDFAFLRIENEMLLNVADPTLREKAIDGKYFYQSEIDYRKIGVHYLPFSIHTRKYASNTNPLVTTADGTKLQYTDLAFLLTDFEDSKFEKIKNKSKANPNSDINGIDWPYNKAFWDSYNVLMLNPLNSRVMTHLERKTSLKKQFERK